MTNPLKPLLAPPSNPATPIYRCSVCHTVYASAPQAVTCSKSAPLDQQVRNVKLGDFVVVEEGYGWSSNQAWVYDEKGHKFHGTPTLRFWFLVMDVTNEAAIKGAEAWEDNRKLHRAILHLATGAANTHQDGELKGFRLGWTPVAHHRTIKVVPQETVPQALRDASKHLIGRTFERLL